VLADRAMFVADSGTVSTSSGVVSPPDGVLTYDEITNALDRACSSILRSSLCTVEHVLQVCDVSGGGDDGSEPDGRITRAEIMAAPECMRQCSVRDIALFALGTVGEAPAVFVT
jgi:hypothetical protein